MQNSADAFYILGHGIKADFVLKNGVTIKHLGYRFIEKGHFKNNEFITAKLWNGDK
ncbi:DUF5597 domain-containing protein [Lacihabitans sp. CS3-21]|uniref:DUF5597 domain-containing protein n=1 Tax=Lacihabitans sp. CS3-21 TaxID=2487332 RepID=UPI0038F69A29